MSRAVDADVLLELYADRLEKLKERYGVHSGECGVLAGAMKLLEIQPTIEVQKKGRWMLGRRAGYDESLYWYIYCSECLWERDDDNHDKDTPFCPNCGARLEGKV